VSYIVDASKEIERLSAEEILTEEEEEKTKEELEK